MRIITSEDIESRPLTEAEKGWLQQRDRHAEVTRNEELFGRPVEDGSDEREVGVGPQSTQDGATDNYDSWKVKELVEEGEARTPPVDFSGCKLKDEYIAAMRAWDAEHPDTTEE